MGDFSDLNTDHVKERTCRRVAAEGFDAWYREYAERADLLSVALEHYNNGRMKRALCELFIREDMETLRDIMRRAEPLRGKPAKEAGKAFTEITEAVSGKR